MNNINFKLFAVIIFMMINISCGERDIIGPDDNGISLFDLKVTSIGLIVILSWDAIDNSDLTGYNIYRQEDGGGFAEYDSVLGEENSFTDLTVKVDKVYDYYITAKLTDNRESISSDTLRIIPSLTTLDLRVTSIALKVILSWDAIDNSTVTGNNIYRREEGGGFVKYDSVLSEENSFTDLTVTADKKYEYYITAKLTENIESLPSDSLQIIPGLTTTWVLDNSTRILNELTHDVAHKTGNFFDNLPFVTAFDIDENRGYIYLLNGSAKTLMLYIEGQEPATFTNPDSTFTLFDDPSDIDYDSVRDDMWIADGLSGNIYRYSQTNPGEWVLADSLNTGGSADVGQIADNGDYWVINSKGKSVEIYQKRNTGYNRINIGGFSSGGILLALDEKRARAYAVDIDIGAVSVITATGIETPISTINKAIAAAVEPEFGDLWLLADDDEDGSYDLIKLSVTGGRIFEIDTGMSSPTWMGVNSYNLNVVVLNRTFDEPKVATFDKLGNNINTFESLTEPVRARIVKLD
ncbi:hypothetical protein E3V36_04780 [Candidatus Marinimicrobia bacterium MT.SAG.2]|nr:hypothetical protein E3V36_04780 [Candidatus Marinimicrobia bacterium MT.SAG.2]